MAAQRPVFYAHEWEEVDNPYECRNCHFGYKDYGDCECYPDTCYQCRYCKIRVQDTDRGRALKPCMETTETKPKSDGNKTSESVSGKKSYADALKTKK